MAVRTSGGGGQTPTTFLVYDRPVRGEAEPLMRVRGLRSVKLEVENQSIIVSDKRLNSVLTIRVPDLF